MLLIIVFENIKNNILVFFENGYYFFNLGGCIQSLLLMTFADLKSIGVFNTDF